MQRPRLFGICLGLLSLWIVLAGKAAPALGGEQVIANVPCYYWYNGCGPTSLGMIVGYWEGQGFSNLIVGGSNDWNANQTNIQNMIASPGQIADYGPTPDRQPPPAYHTDDCLADFDKCSRNPQPFGWSYFSDQAAGLTGYANYCGYQSYNYQASQSYYSASLWNQVTTAINASHPLQFLVDSDGDGITDHFVTVIGYNDTGGVQQYACWDTWDSTVLWETFHPVTSGNAWGVYGATFFSMSTSTLIWTGNNGSEWSTNTLSPHKNWTTSRRGRRQRFRGRLSKPRHRDFQRHSHRLEDRGYIPRQRHAGFSAVQF